MNIDPANPTVEDYEKAEMFICRLYQDPHADTLDKIRVRTLLSSNKPEENPPTSDAVYFHICRAFHQASRLLYAHVKNHSTLTSPVASKGWIENEDGDLIPVMMSKAPMSEAIEDNITCNCQTDCTKKFCKCRKRGIVCTQLCHKKLKYSQEYCLNLRHNREEEEEGA